MIFFPNFSPRKKNSNYNYNFAYFVHRWVKSKNEKNWKTQIYWEKIEKVKDVCLKLHFTSKYLICINLKIINFIGSTVDDQAEAVGIWALE